MKSFTGISSPHAVPTASELVVNADGLSLEYPVGRVLRLLRERSVTLEL